MSARTSKALPTSVDRPRSTRQTTLLRMPEKFNDGEDAQEDVAAPKTKGAMYMNQSFMSIIANVGSTSNFRPDARQDVLQGLATTTEDNEDENDVGGEGFDEGIHTAGFRKPRVRQDLISQSVPSLERPPPKHFARTRMSDTMSSSQILMRPRSGDEQVVEPSVVKTGEDTSSKECVPTQEPSVDEDSTGMDDLVEEGYMEESQEQTAEARLADQIAHMFGFAEVENVLAEYPCWLLQNILLQGYLYITQRHLCFYSYLPQESKSIIKSGFLFKRGRQNPKYRRWWFTLKGDTLAYFSDPSNLYFPSGSIDLRSGVLAEITASQGKDKNETNFTITTHQRTYLLRAESGASAKEWVKQIQKVIFRSHNEGDAVKISLPISNVVDIEENPVMNFAETFKIRIFDNDETYAIDEYFFSFFDPTSDALSFLRNVVEENAMHKVNQGIFHDKRITESHTSTQSRDAISEPHFEDERPGSARILQNRNDVFIGSPRVSEFLSHFDGSEGHKVAAQRGLDGRSISSRPTPQPAYGEPALGQSSDDSSCAPSRRSSDGSAFTTAQTPQRGELENPTIALRKGLSTDSLRRPRPECARLSDSQDPVLKVSEADLTTALASASQTNLSLLDSETIKKTSRPGSIVGRPTSVRQSSSAAALQDLVRVGAYPLQRASTLAGLLKIQSRRMGSLLANESKGYYGKVMSMWAGERMHYDEFEGRISNDDFGEDKEDEEDGSHYGDRYRAHFTLPDSEKLQATYHGYLHRVVPIYGKIYIGDKKLCFRSLVPGIRTKMVLPLRDIENINQEKGFRFGYSGLVVVIHGHEELFFEFSKPDARDDCAVTILKALDGRKRVQDPMSRSPEQEARFQVAKAESQNLERARRTSLESIRPSRRGSTDSDAAVDERPIVFDDALVSIVDFKPTISMKITCLTIGSRGDVQPYIALCKGLLAEGHRPTIATHAEFEPWIKEHGIDFAPVAGDPAEIMRLCVENDMFTLGFFREASSKFRGWIDDLLESSWKACQGSDLLIESPSAMGGIHIAEALQIPYFRAFTMPWTQTRSYPHAFAVPNQKLGGNYNSFTYVLFDSVFWTATAGQINRWRKQSLGIQATSLDKLQTNKVPFLYNFSPSVVVKPLDFPHWIRITGYWFLDEGSSYRPPKELTDFIAQARADRKKLVYVGFGSIVVDDSAALTQTVVQSVLKADVRCILSKGWSERLDKKINTARTEVSLPPEIHQIKSAPHDWLFRQMDAAAHHGGAGTTGASLRAGIPTIIKPFFGDQFFFGQRVEDLGVGKCLKVLNTSVFARALWEVTNSERMIVKAQELGKAIRAENGVDIAIQSIYRDLDYARSLIKQHDSIPAEATTSSSAATTAFPGGPEESWTMVDDNDVDVVKSSGELSIPTPLRRHPSSAQSEEGYENE